MNDYLQQFRAWLVDEDKGDKTVRTYLGVMSKFIEWFDGTTGNEFHPGDVSPVLLQDYRSYLQNVASQKPASINKALATLKTFFGWAMDAGYASSNPSLKVKMKRVQSSHDAKWLTVNEQHRLVDILDIVKNDFKRVRDHAIVLTMLQAGLRVDEVSKLRVLDIDLRNESVNVVAGKGGKYRCVPMTKELRKALKAWLSFRSSSEKSTHTSSEFLFVSERSGQMTTRGISYLVDGYMERCGVKTDGRSCHSLRHTFCKNLVDAGWPIQNVARVAGHDSIQTTMRYVEPSQDDLRKAMQHI